MLVERADALLGKVLASLQRRGLTERTLVVALGDDGEGFGEKGVRQHNNYYEARHRAHVVIEVGTHSGWVSELLKDSATRSRWRILVG